MIARRSIHAARWSGEAASTLVLTMAMVVRGGECQQVSVPKALDIDDLPQVTRLVGADDGAGLTGFQMLSNSHEQGDDYGVGICRETFSPGGQRPYLQLFTGKTLAPGKRAVLGKCACGATVVIRSLPDVDHDGVDDIVVGDMSSQSPSIGGMGAVLAFSGRTLEPLWSAFAPESGSWLWFGAAIDSIPDEDGDGLADILVGAPSREMDAQGQLFVLSSTSGKLLRIIKCAQASSEFGRCIQVVGRVGEDKDDFCLSVEPGHVGMLDSNTCSGGAGATSCPHHDKVMLVSLDSGVPHWSIFIAPAAVPSGQAAVTLVPARDRGAWDFAVGRLGGEVEIRDTASGSLLSTLNQNRQDLGNRIQLWCRDDVTGDGIPDLLVGLPDSSAPGPLFEPGRIQVWSAGDQCVAEFTGGLHDRLGMFVSTCRYVKGDGVGAIVVGSDQGSSPKPDYRGSLRIINANTLLSLPKAQRGP